MVTKVFQLLLLLSPIAIGTNVAPEMFDMIFFRLGIVALFMASLLDKPKREMPQDIKWGILSLLGLVFINIFIHTFAPMVMMHSQNLFLGLIGFYIVYIYSEIKDFKKYILFAGLINLLFFLCQKFKFDPVFDIKTYPGEEGAFLGNKQRLMTYFALITSLSLNIWLLIGAVILGLYTKQIIIFIPIVLCLWKKIKNKREHLGFWIVVLLGIFLFRDKIIYSLLYRFNTAWKPALQLFFDRPLLGYGLGVRPIEGLEVLGNSYLQFLLGVGILGAVWFGYIFKKFWKAIISDVAIISLVLIMCIEYPIEIPRLWFLIIATIIMFLIKQKGVLQNEGSQ